MISSDWYTPIMSHAHIVCLVQVLDLLNVGSLIMEEWLGSIQWVDLDNTFVM